MNKVFKWSGGVLLCASMPLMAEETKLPNASVDVNATVVSNYVFRGNDMFQNRFVQKRKEIDGKNIAPAFQPSITFKTPVDGLTFNVWGSFALSGREDKDVDQRIQTGRGAYNTAEPGFGNNPLVDAAQTFGTSGVAAAQAQLYSSYTTLATPTHNLFSGTAGQSIANQKVATFYKDVNGLKRLDEIDLTLAYSSATRVGVLGFGIIHYGLANAKGKANPFGGIANTANYYATEMYVSYALPMLPDLTAKLSSDIVNSNQYYQLLYSKTFNVSDSVAVSVNTGPGYSVQTNLYTLNGGAGQANDPAIQTLQGWKEWTSNVGVTVKGFTVGVNAAYRPDLRFFDLDYGTNRALEVDGGSTMDDGLIPNPATSGSGIYADLLTRTVTTAVRNRTGNQSYTYTPRQKLPKWLYWVNLGYTASF